MALEGPRAARFDELPAVVEMSNTVFGQGAPHDMGRWFPTLFCRENLGHLRVFVDDGRPVALAGYTLERVVVPGASFVAALVGSVCTLASHQGRGLGSRLMEDCTAAARAEGASVLLISGGRGLYRRMGAIDAGRYATVKVPRGAMPDAPAAGRRSVREWRISDVPRMSELQRAEPVRFERTEDQLMAYLRTGRVSCRPCRTWVACAPGEPARVEAYLCVQESRETPEGRIISVQEFGGSRGTVLESLASILQEMGADRAEIDCLGSDQELPRLAASRGLTTVARGFQGTVKAIDPPRLLPALKRFAGPTVTVWASAEGFTVRLGTESFDVRGLDEVTAFLFGSVERQPLMPGPGPLRAALESGFPIPLPDYGLTYI
jgi:GNAT superfamily N-acetyltransferase